MEEREDDVEYKVWCWICLQLHIVLRATETYFYWFDNNRTIEITILNNWLIKSMCTFGYK